MTEERRVQLVAEVDTTRTRAGFNEIGQQASTMASNVERSGDQAQRAVSDIGSGADRSARAVETAQRNLIGSIQRTTAAMEAGGRSSAQYYELLARQRGVDPAVLAPYLEQLRAVEAAQVSANNALGSTAPVLGRVGVSAAQTAAALRGVPAQFTDIVTSIQGGQAPLTVFLQQGGQLRDMFGSAGGAARALGGYVVGLVNPFTIAAAAVAGLAYAYNVGAKESDAYAKALILTGNAAGTTTSQLTDMARSISKNVGTQGQAAETLAALAGTGKVGAENLQRFGEVAIKSQRSLGISASEMAKNFAELGAAPLQATDKLNEQYHYLTASTRAQIQALTDLGKTEEAAAVAQNAFADTFDDKSQKMEARLGSIERGWRAVKEGIQGAGSALADIGREDTFEQKMVRAQAAVAKAQAARYTFAGAGADGKTELDNAQRYLESLLNQKKVKEITAQYDAEEVKRQEAINNWNKEGLKYLDRKAQRDKELDRADITGRASAARGEGVDVTEQRIRDRQAAIRKEYSDIYNDDINSQIEAIKRRGAAEDIVSKRSLDLLNANKAAGIVSEQAYIEQVAGLELAEFAKRKDRLQQELALTSGKQNSQKDQAALRGQIAEEDARATSRQIQLTNDLYVLQAKTEADVFKQVLASTAQRQALNATLEVEYQLYGKSADARELAMVSVKSELELQKKISEAIAAKKPLTDEYIGQLRAEKDMLDEVTRSTVAQTKALGYAQQLSDENKKFAAEAIFDERARAAAILRIDAATWQERISLAGEGTEAQRKLQEEYVVWYRNQVSKPEIEAQRKLWGAIESTAHDTFISIFDSGKSAFDRLRDALKNGLLELLYQMTVKKWILSIGAQVSSSGALGALSGGDSSGGSSAMSILGTGASLFNAGKTIYSGFSTGIASTLGTQIASLGTTFGSTAAQGFGMGLSSAGTSAVGKEYLAQNVAGYSAGSSAAAAIPIIGWIIAGMQAAAGFRAQGFDPNNGTTSLTGQAVGAVPLVLNKQLQQLGVGSALANILTGASINTRLFGRANPVVESQGLEGTINTGGIEATSFANILEKGGWFRSDKRYTNTAPLDAANDEMFDATIKSMIAAVRGFGTAMGIESSQIDSYSKSFKIDLSTDEAKNQEAIAKLFSTVGDELSTKLVPSIAALGAKGETASTTLQRVATDYAVLDETFRAIGKTFGAVGIDSLSARERLIALSGGIEALTSGTSTFAQNFLSPEEQFAPVAKYVAEQMAALGYASVTTAEQFKNLVLSLDVTTESGAKSYAALIALNPAFKQVTDAAAAAIAKAQAAAKVTLGLNDQVFALTHSATEVVARQREAELAAMSASDAAIQRRIYALTDEKAANEAAAAAAKVAADAKQVADQQVQAIRANAYGSFADAITRSIAAAQEAAKAFRGLNDSLLVGDSSTLSAEQKYTQAKRLFGASDSTNRQEAEQTFLAVSKERFGASSLDYQRDFAAVIARNAADAIGRDQQAAGLLDFMNRIPVFGAIGAHENGGVAAGWSWVGEKGPELVNFTEPARVYTAPQSRAMMGGGRIPEELQEEVKLMRTELKAAMEAVALNTSSTVRLLKRVIVNDVLQTETPAP